MTYLPKSLLAAAALTATTMFAMPAAAQTALISMAVNDTSADAQADFAANLAALGVRVNAGEQFTASEIEDAKRIMNDQSNASLKASRIEEIVNGDGPFMMMDD